ncbi:MAG: DVU0298 family protein [bacterium]
MGDYKETIREFLRGRQYQEILGLLGENRKIVRLLRSILYDEEPIIRWRAVTMFGRLAVGKPEWIKKEVARLLWSMNDEAGAIGRAAPETIGEIARNNIHLAEEAVKVVIQYIRDPETCRPPNRNVEILTGVLWAIGRVGSRRLSMVKKVMPVIESFLEDPDPSVRGHAAWCLGQLDGEDTRERLEKLSRDPGMTLLYENEELRLKSVAIIVEDALTRCC